MRVGDQVRLEKFSVPTMSLWKEWSSKRVTPQNFTCPCKIKPTSPAIIIAEVNKQAFLCRTLLDRRTFIAAKCDLILIEDIVGP